MQQIYRSTPMTECDFNKVALQHYWNHTSAWVFSCKFAAYFHNTFCYEHLWTTASEKRFEVDFIVGVSLIKELSVNYFRKNVHLKCLKGF